MPAGRLPLRSGSRDRLGPSSPWWRSGCSCDEVEVMSGAVRIVDAYWNRFLAVEPLFATAVGDARFDDVLPDPSDEGRAERQRVHAGLLEAAAGVDPSGLDP